jgi:hypothetical protein
MPPKIKTRETKTTRKVGTNGKGEKVVKTVTTSVYKGD